MGFTRRIGSVTNRLAFLRAAERKLSRHFGERSEQICVAYLALCLCLGLIFWLSIQQMKLAGGVADAAPENGRMDSLLQLSNERLGQEMRECLENFPAECDELEKHIHGARSQMLNALSAQD